MLRIGWVRLTVMPSLRNRSARLALHLAFVDHAHRVHRIAAQEQVVDHAAFQALVKFLVDHGDTVFRASLGPEKLISLPLSTILPSSFW